VGNILTKITLMIGVLSLLILTSVLYGGNIPRTLYVLNGLGRTLSKMNLQTFEITNDFLQVGDIPNQVVGFGERIYVLNSTPPEIMVINPQNERVEKRIGLAEGSNPWFMAVVESNRVYVTNYLANIVSVVDLESGLVVKDIPVGVGPEGILLVENTAFVANTGGYPDFASSSVSLIDLATDEVTTTLPMPSNAQDLALASDGRVHVVCSGLWEANAGKVCVIDRWAGPDTTPAVVDTIELGGWSGDIAIIQEGRGYLPDWGDEESGFLYSYDTYTGDVYHNRDNPIRIGKGAMRVLYDGEEDVIWVSNFSDDTVQKFNPQNDSVMATYGFGDGPQDMAIYGGADFVDEAKDIPLPSGFALEQNYPNPFNSATTVHYTIPQVIGERFKVKGVPNTSLLIPITLKVYNIAGQEVRALVDEEKGPGRYFLLWDGKDSGGNPVASGVYICRLEVEEQRAKKVRKMLLIR